KSRRITSVAALSPRTIRVVGDELSFVSGSRSVHDRLCPLCNLSLCVERKANRDFACNRRDRFHAGLRRSGGSFCKKIRRTAFLVHRPDPGSAWFCPVWLGAKRRNIHDCDWHQCSLVTGRTALSITHDAACLALRTRQAARRSWIFAR